MLESNCQQEFMGWFLHWQIQLLISIFPSTSMYIYTQDHHISILQDWHLVMQSIYNWGQCIYTSTQYNNKISSANIYSLTITTLTYSSVSISSRYQYRPVHTHKLPFPYQTKGTSSWLHTEDRRVTEMGNQSTRPVRMWFCLKKVDGWWESKTTPTTIWEEKLVSVWWPWTEVGSCSLTNEESIYTLTKKDFTQQIKVVF